MDSNPYAPPNATGADVSPVHADASGTPAFFPTSRTKLLILSFCTFGIYEYYWFYKNWSAIRVRTNASISPFWRAFFAIFYCYPLFDRVRKHSPDSPASSLNAGLLAAVWIILTLLWKLPDPYWLVVFLAVFAMLPIQDAMNAVNRSVAPNHDPNNRFTAWNWVAVTVGGPLFLLAVYVTFFPPQ